MGKVLSAEEIGKNEVKLEFDLVTKKEQIIAEMANFFEPEELIGKELPIFANTLEPRMILTVGDKGRHKGKPVLLSPVRALQ